MTYRNLMLTMLAGGLWHGAAWTFVAWGGAHGIAQVVHAEFKRRFPPAPWQEPFRRIVSWFITLNFVCMAWILFRSSTFGIAWLMLRRYLLIDRGGSETIPLWLMTLGPTLLLAQYLMRRMKLQENACRLQLPSFAFAYGVAWALAIALLPLGYRPFIYFQF
jgi:alginate O-acetyltransferase complex protein AlgI